MGGNFAFACLEKLLDQTRSARCHQTQSLGRDDFHYPVVILESGAQFIQESLRAAREFETDPSKRVSKMPANICGIIRQSLLDPLQDAEQPAGMGLGKAGQRGRSSTSNHTVPVLEHVHQFLDPARVIHDGPDDLRSAQLGQRNCLLPVSGNTTVRSWFHHLDLDPQPLIRQFEFITTDARS